MAARELTKEYTRISNELFTTKKQVEYLTEETKKLRMILEDLRLDVKMMQNRR